MDRQVTKGSKELLPDQFTAQYKSKMTDWYDWLILTADRLIIFIYQPKTVRRLKELSPNAMSHKNIVEDKMTFVSVNHIGF